MNNCLSAPLIFWVLMSLLVAKDTVMIRSSAIWKRVRCFCVSAGRKQEEVAALLERLSDPDAVEAVSMDMSASFRPAVQLCLPKAQIVVDHFHVIQHVMKGYKKVLSIWAHKKEGKPLLEGKQYLFLKAKGDRSSEHRKERASIGEHLPLLEVAWQLKEELRTWYATATVTTA